MIVVGVTGGIGSGKTTVCKVWEKLGATVVYADDLAKKLMVEEEDLREALAQTFGQNTFLDDGTLNRSHLIKEAFKKGRVEELNKIVHPAVAARFVEITKEAEKNGTRMIVEEAALLLNNGRPPIFDVIVIVRSSRVHRLQRVSKRDSVPREVVLDRDQEQPDFENLLHLSDYTLLNNGTLDELKANSRSLFQEILSNHKK